MLRQEIVKLTNKSIKDLQKKGFFPRFKNLEIKLEHPENKSHGDYSTNIAMVISKQARKNPLEVAGLIVNNLKTTPLFKKVEVVKPGFINFFLSGKYLQEYLREISKQGDKFGTLKLGKKQKVNIEFISANPTGPLHIGNGRGAFFGDCLGNIFKKAGYKVTKEYFLNDSRNSTQIQELGKTALGQGTSYMSPYLKSMLSELKPSLKRFKSETDAGYFVAQNIIGETRDFIQAKLKIKFDYWVSEHVLYRSNKAKQVYASLKRKGLLWKKEGATWLVLSKFGQKDEVLIRKNGQPTYFLSDIVYHKNKIDRRFKKIINIWGADHQGHVPRTKKIMEILGYKGEFKVLITQIVRLKEGKMSKRKGKIVTLEWLLDEVGLDATRFFYLTKSLDSQMEFDVKLAKEKSSKSPVYYVQYAHARICSILKKVPVSKIRAAKKTSFFKLKLLKHQSELDLILHLIKFPEIVEDIAKDYQVQRLSQYTLELAASFHQFYRECQVINSDEDLTQARIYLLLATKNVLKNSLKLMGISTPEKM